jgi:hypothetical protein
LHKYLLPAFCALIGVLFFMLAVFLGHIAFEPTKAIEGAAKASKQSLSEWIRSTLRAAIKG